jgi:hypothetical protein
MVTIAGRTFGVWSLLAIIFGTAVMIPSIATLLVTLLAVATAIF